MKKKLVYPFSRCRNEIVKLLLITKISVFIFIMTFLNASANSLFWGSNDSPQQRKITGLITDSETGEALPGVNIQIEGTYTGTTSGVDGRYSLDVPRENSVLLFSFIGYNTQRVQLAGQSVLNVVLAPDITALEEVVVVGYGQQKKESVVGAISQLSSDEILSTPVANISQAISGKISGVITSQGSGTPGDDNAKIYIRGRATFAGDGQPLVLVDGIERDFSQIAPDDIETISVLKDASATAVYGVRGANGVILVTTKRGHDQKPMVSLTANWQSQTPTRKDTYLNSHQSVLLLEEALANNGLPSQFSASDIEMYRRASAGELSGVDAMLYPDVDWYKSILRSSAPAQRYNVNVQGGTKRMRYFTSGELYNQKGLFKDLSLDQFGNSSNTNYSRYAFRANLDYLLTNDFTVSINFGTRFEERTGGSASENTTFYELNHTPGWLFPVSYTIGEGDAQRTLWGGSSQYQNNIGAVMAVGGFYKSTTTVTETNFIANYNLNRFVQGLSARAMVSLDYNAFYNRRFSANFATYELNDRDNYTSIDAYNKFNVDTKLAALSAQNRNTMTLYMEYQLNYARRFGKHDVTAMALYNKNDRRANADLAQRYQGLVGRVTYGYNNRYLAEFNAGYNGSENFLEGKRFGFFPSFSLGWRVTQEEFMASTKGWLDNLKIKATYGQVGNDKYEGQRFLYLENWTQATDRARFGTSNASTITEGAYPNYDVTWERAEKFNAGIEFGLFDDFIDGNIDFFSETRDNILTEYLSRPGWIGVSMAAGNLGRTKNKGYEVELRHANRISNNFNYTIGFTYGHAKNKIIDMNEPDSKTEYRKQEGKAIGQYFGLVAEGFVTTSDMDNPDFPVSTYGDVQVGDLKYRDINKDGYIDDRDVTAIGYSDIPENTYSITAGFNYKGLGLNMTLQGVSHVSRYYDAEAMFAFIGGGKVKEHHMDRWDPSQSEAYNLANAKYPLLHYDNFGDHNQRLNSFFLQNGAFLRLKNVELSYKLPSAWSRQAGMSDIRVYVNASNLLTRDHVNKIADPESNGSNRYPIMKTINCGVNVKF